MAPPGLVLLFFASCPSNGGLTSLSPRARAVWTPPRRVYLVAVPAALVCPRCTTRPTSVPSPVGQREEAREMPCAHRTLPSARGVRCRMRDGLCDAYLKHFSYVHVFSGCHYHGKGGGLRGYMYPIARTYIA